MIFRFRMILQFRMIFLVHQDDSFTITVRSHDPAIAVRSCAMFDEMQLGGCVQHSDAERVIQR